MFEYAFLSDLVIDLWKNKGAPSKPPHAKRQREIAEMLDHVLTSREEFCLYLEQLNLWLSGLHRRLRTEGVRLEDITYLQSVEHAVLDRAFTGPFRDRNDADLQSLRVDQLALNAAALESLHEELLDDPPAAWMDTFAESGTRRLAKHAQEILGASQSSTEKAESHREVLEVALRGSGGTSAEPTVSSAAARRSRTKSVMLRFPATDPRINWIEGRPENLPDIYLEIVLSLDETRKVLSIRTGGIAKLQTGCTIVARWHSKNGERAAGSAQDDDVGLVLSSTSAWAPGRGETVELEFQCTSHPAYHFELDSIPVEFKQRMSASGEDR